MFILYYDFTDQGFSINIRKSRKKTKVSEKTQLKRQDLKWFKERNFLADNNPIYSQVKDPEPNIFQVYSLRFG